MDRPEKVRDLPIDEEGAALRGKVVEMFGRLERSLDSVILHYYTPDGLLATYLSLDMLTAEGFSFGLRREVFEKIVRRHSLYDSDRMQHLHRAGRWRNFLVHVAGMETHVYEGEDDSPKKIGHRDPRHPNPVLTVAEAFERFKPEWELADDYVTEIRRKVAPTRRTLQSGHILLDPVAPGETYEDWINSPLFPDDPPSPKEPTG